MTQHSEKEVLDYSYSPPEIPEDVLKRPKHLVDVLLEPYIPLKDLKGRKNLPHNKPRNRTVDCDQ